MTELLAVPAFLEVEDCPGSRVRTGTLDCRVGMGRTDCRELGECRGRMDWTESRDQQELLDCRDLRDLLELPDPEEGLETRESPDLLDLWDHRDRQGRTAAMDLPDLQVLLV